MPATIQITDVGSATDDGKYQVAWTADTAQDMPVEVFVHTYATRKYSHVAFVSDLTLPTVPTPGNAFYRSSTAQAVFDDITSAANARANVSAAVQALVDAHKAGLVELVTPDTTVYV